MPAQMSVSEKTICVSKLLCHYCGVFLELSVPRMTVPDLGVGAKGQLMMDSSADLEYRSLSPAHCSLFPVMLQE